MRGRGAAGRSRAFRWAESDAELREVADRAVRALLRESSQIEISDRLTSKQVEAGMEGMAGRRAPRGRVGVGDWGRTIEPRSDGRWRQAKLDGRRFLAEWQPAVASGMLE
jgi:hypothetical protein